MRSKRRVSARRSVSATASGWSAKRAAIASGVARTWLWLPRRRGSEASSVVCSRMATKASCSRARAGVCAWTLPVATQGTPRRAASAARPRLSARSWRWKGRCSSTRKRVATEGAQQPAHGRLVADALARAAAEADQSLGMGLDVLEADARIVHHARHPRRRAARAPRALAPRHRLIGAVHARVGMGVGEQPAEVGPPAGVAHEQGEVARVVGRLVGDRHLRAVDRAQAPQVARGLRELHRARDRVVVGERQRGVPALQRGGHQLVGQRGAVQEGEGGVAVELDVRHANACSHGGRTDAALIAEALRGANSIIEGRVSRRRCRVPGARRFCAVRVRSATPSRACPRGWAL